MTEMTDAEKMAITKYDLYYESRMTKVESAIESLKTDIKQIHTDLRLMLGAFATFGIGILGLMAHGFKWF
jgi:hypothetical protein